MNPRSITSGNSSLLCNKICIKKITFQLLTKQRGKDIACSECYFETVNTDSAKNIVVHVRIKDDSEGGMNSVVVYGAGSSNQRKIEKSGIF